MTFSQIIALQNEFGTSFEVRFCPLQLHVHTAIWGAKRIYSSLVLRGTYGQESPCIEIFPGLKSAELFHKFEKDFDYVWDRSDLTFTLEEIAPLYAKLLAAYPLEISLQAADPTVVHEVESAAAALKFRP